jgi:DNA-binding response OmpR family regulator
MAVMMLSAKGQADDVTVRLKSGARLYITKPFGPSELALRLEAVLAQVSGRR